jgi:uncharacterized protein
MNPIDIIKEYYDPESDAFRILVAHGKQVAQKALEAATMVSHLKPDRIFIEEAAMLHDIGIFLTSLPEIGCNGNQPYVCHGYLGREILEKKGFKRHALVCERHVGVGISAAEIKRYHLPMPVRDMLPKTIEEKLICYADKFFSKSTNGNNTEISVEKILRRLAPYGEENVQTFKRWDREFRLTETP